MSGLKLIFGPDPIFSKSAETVTRFDDDLCALAEAMVETLYTEKAVGIGANMVGQLKNIVVIDLQENGTRNPLIFINPTITDKSEDTQCHDEASICFPGISASITRPRKITLSYQDCAGSERYMTTEDYLATVLQHEIDYLNGIIFLDYLSPMKRKILLKKTVKFQKQAGLR